jgi:hypothetical protein
MISRRMKRTILMTTAGIVLLGATAEPPPPARSNLADVYEFSLRPTRRASGANAVGRLNPPYTPFGIAVTPDGFLAYDLELKVDGLRPARAIGAATYSVWMTTPELDRFEKLGNMEESGVFRVPVTGMNKFILIITAESDETATKRAGPVMLRGVSPSGLLTAFGTHELFSTMPHE